MSTTNHESTDNHASATDLAAAGEFRVAFEATADERVALADTDLLPINIDIPTAVGTVLAAVPRIQGQRDEIAGAFTRFNAVDFDSLRTYALALAHANTRFLAVSGPLEELPKLAQRAGELRALLLADANALVQRGLLDGRPLAALKGSHGYLNVASDLGVIADMLRERWSTIASKTAVEAANLEEAERVFEAITLAHAERNAPSAAAATVGDDRRRAFSLMVRAYGLTRSQIAFVRREQGDVDRIAPSLWKGRGGHGSPLPADEPIGTVSGPGGTHAVTPPVVAAGIPPRLQGSSPFIDGDDPGK